MINGKSSAFIAVVCVLACAHVASATEPPRTTSQLNASSLASARAASRATAQATGGSSTVTVTVPPVGASNGNGGGFGSSGPATVIDQRTAPSVVVPSVGGGGYDCPVVGFGVGGTGMGGGGGFGPTWISSRCDHRKYAALIAELSGREAAIAYLRSVEPDVDAALRAMPVASVVPAAAAPRARPDWCGTASPQERRRYPECVG